MDKLLASFDRQIRAGQGQSVRKALLATDKKKIPRPQLALWAWLAWRVGAAEKGVEWLNNVVRPKARSPQTASAREKAEYAACLTRLGAVSEALEILESIPTKEVPQAALYQVFALVAQWNYAETVPHLEAYLKTRPAAYDSLIARVNLAAALIFLKEYERALGLLQTLEKETAADNHRLLWGNVLELRASVFIHMGKWKAALEECRRAQTQLKEHGGVFALLIEKWAAVARFGISSGGRKALPEVKAKAAAIGHWESVRDCERFEAIIRRDTDLFKKVYFGTPYEGFRRRLVSDFPIPVEIPSHYERELGEGSKRRVLDLGNLGGDLKAGRQNHRCLSILASDFYRPFRSAQLHALLFPGEFYNPHSSRHRTAEAMYRLKSWLKKEIPALVVSRGTHGYRLTAKSPVSLRMREEIVGVREPELEVLRRIFSETPFSISEAMDNLNMARRTASRQLQAWVGSGALSRLGAGQSTRYQFNDEVAERAAESETKKAAASRRG